MLRESVVLSVCQLILPCAFQVTIILRYRINHPHMFNMVVILSWLERLLSDCTGFFVCLFFLHVECVLCRDEKAKL